MNIPASVKIGSAVCEVRVTDTVQSIGGDDVLGYSRGSNGHIDVARNWLNEPCPEEVMADTFLHECLHVANNNMGLGLSERQVCGVTACVMMLIRDNNLDFRVPEL